MDVKGPMSGGAVTSASMITLLATAEEQSSRRRINCGAAITPTALVKESSMRIPTLGLVSMTKKKGG